MHSLSFKMVLNHEHWLSHTCIKEPCVLSACICYSSKSHQHSKEKNELQKIDFNENEEKNSLMFKFLCVFFFLAFSFYLSRLKIFDRILNAKRIVFNYFFAFFLLLSCGSDRFVIWRKKFRTNTKKKKLNPVNEWLIYQR